MTDRPHHRPMKPGAEFFTELGGGADPALIREAGDLAATLLVRGVRESDDSDMAERVVRLAETEGLETLAQVWAGAPADTLAGALWRLYVLRSWVHGSPRLAAREFDAGRQRAQVARVVAGVAEPPGPDELRAMVDEVLRGIGADFAMTLMRAAAFARIIATGRAALGVGDAAHSGGTPPGEVGRMLTLAEQLETAGLLELRAELV
ncbi:hypothetical protein [Nocardioides seonyuensis]|nr:hypothetical protein [Nocardioides seonyuensis]